RAPSRSARGRRHAAGAGAVTRRVRTARRHRSNRRENRVKSAFMASRSGEELKEELESRQEPRLVRALEMVAPGTALREGIDNILHAHTGGLIVIGDADEY